MINQKAPKDMTFEEGVAYVEKVFADGKKSGCYSDGTKYTFAELIEFLHRRLKEPAPNPFTDDQIAVMLEYQKDGYKYAAKSSSGVVCVFKDKPCRVLLHASTVTRETFGSWVTRESPFEVTSFEFLKKVTNWSDPEPLCFADYAPLEDK